MINNIDWIFRHNMPDIPTPGPAPAPGPQPAPEPQPAPPTPAPGPQPEPQPEPNMDRIFDLQTHMGAYMALDHPNQ